jgi:hypothetical protein
MFFSPQAVLAGSGQYPQDATIRVNPPWPDLVQCSTNNEPASERSNWENAMTRLAMFCGLFAALISSNAAFAQQMNADDLKWVNECIRDNRDEPGGTPAIIRAYCICMNEKMDDNESRSITQWEKANPRARRDCERQAGWK